MYALAMFPDPEHPLKAIDPEQQRQVTGRIKRAMKGPKKFLRDGVTIALPDGTTDTYHGDGIEPAPLGERVNVTMGDIARRLHRSERTASTYVNNPEKMDAGQVAQLCELLCVDVSELRSGLMGWGLPSCGADTVAEVYDMLSREDKRLVMEVLRRCLASEGDPSILLNVARDRARAQGRARL